MAKKEKKPKQKKEKKEKKSKKDKGKGKDEDKRDQTRNVTKKVAVCGDEETVRKVVSQSGKLKTDTDGAEVTLNVENGMSGPTEVASGGNYEGVLCVYDMRSQQSYSFLKEQVMNAAKNKAGNAYLMVAGVGLEYRGSSERTLVSNQDLKSLASANGAVCTELISSDANAMADGILSLFIRKDPQSVRQNANNAETKESTEEGGKKKKKGKKEKKPKKEKKEKKPKKEKKSKK
ncbi:hypothetical protein SprV_0401412700 [Sparganum proliferum]